MEASSTVPCVNNGRLVATLCKQPMYPCSASALTVAGTSFPTFSENRTSCSLICKGSKIKKSHLQFHHGSKPKKKGERGEQNRRRKVAACVYCNPWRDVDNKHWYEVPDNMQQHYYETHNKKYRNATVRGSSYLMMCDMCFNMFDKIEDCQAHRDVRVKEGWVRTTVE